MIKLAYLNKTRLEKIAKVGASGKKSGAEDA